MLRHRPETKPPGAIPAQGRPPPLVQAAPRIGPEVLRGWQSIPIPAADGHWSGGNPYWSGPSGPRRAMVRGKPPPSQWRCLLECHVLKKEMKALRSKQSVTMLPYGRLNRWVEEAGIG